MNLLFKKEYHRKLRQWDVRKYSVYSFILASVIVAIIIFYKSIPIESLIVPYIMLILWISTIFDWKYNLPHYFIVEDDSNKLEVRILLFLIATLVLYGFSIGCLHKYFSIFFQLPLGEIIIEKFKEPCTFDTFIKSLKN